MVRIDLNALSAFASVVRLGSFRAAAAERGVTASALSHTIAKLERDLGARILTRSTRAIGLTEAGERLLSAIGPAFKDIAMAVEGVEAMRDAPAGRLRLTAPRIAAMTLLAKALPEFLASHPGVFLDIRVADSFQDLAAHGFDAGVRLGEALRPNMIATPIGPPVAMAIVASPAYLQTAPKVTEPNDLRAHRCIGLRLQSSDEIYQWEFVKGGRTVTVALQSQLVLDDQELILAAASAGLGLAYTTHDYAAPHLQRGTLVRVLEDWTPPDERFFLYYPSRKHLPSALRAFIDFMRRSA